MSRNKILISIILVALLSGFFWSSRSFEGQIQINPDGSYSADEAFYDKVATNILEGRDFCHGIKKPCTEPQPLCPLFLAGVFSVFGHNWDAVRVIQILLFALIAVIVFLLAEELFGRKVAIYSGMLMALFYPLAGKSGQLIREVLFTFLIVLLIYCLYKAYLSQKKRWFVFSGIVLGLAMLTNAVVYFLPLLVVGNFLIIWKRKFFTKKNLLVFFLFLFSLGAILSPWLVRNYYTDKDYVSTVGGSILLGRGHLMEDLQGEYKGHLLGQTFGYFFAKKINLQLDSGKLFRFPPNPALEKLARLSSAGYSQEEINRILRREGLTKIFARPHLYLLTSFLNFLSFNNPMIPDPKNLQSCRIQELFVGTHPELSDFIKGSIILFIRFFWLVFFFFVGYAVYAIFVSRQFRDRDYISRVSEFLTRNRGKTERKTDAKGSASVSRHISWVILPIIYFNLIYSLLFGIPRYALPIYAFYIMLFVIGFLNFSKPRTSNLQPQTVCYFGSYDPNYSRNRILIRGLKENGIKVLECNDRSKGLKRYLRLILGHRKIKNQYNLVIVGFPRQWVSFDLLLAKVISRKPVIFDAFTSIYDSLVLDKQLVEKGSLKARFYWFLDWLNCRLADKILLDTNEQIKYFTKTFKIRPDKFKRIFVGADDRVFHAGIRSLQALQGSDPCVCSFHGTFIPLQGVEYIIRAAKILEGEKGICFELLGRGQTYEKAKRLVKDFGLKNITFFDCVLYEELPNFIARAQIYLGGPFGSTPKAQRVIPNKVYEAIAMKKPVIVSNTPAIRELFTNEEDCLMCRIADEKDLARKILKLKANPDLRKRIAENSFRLFQEKLTPKKLLSRLFLDSNNHHTG